MNRQNCSRLTLNPNTALPGLVLVVLLLVGGLLGACDNGLAQAESTKPEQNQAASDSGAPYDSSLLGADREWADQQNSANDTGINSELDAGSNINDAALSDRSLPDDDQGLADELDASTGTDSSGNNALDAAVAGECGTQNPCADNQACMGGICRDSCLYTCLFSETGELCIDGYCVDCENSADCPNNQYSCDPESHACIELGFSPDPVELDCAPCPNGSLCGGGGVATECGKPEFGPGWCTAGESIPNNWSYLENGRVRIGADMRRGAAIGHFSSLTSSGNILDENDTGRYLQQSYYGDDKGGSWNGAPWNFNPVQGGDSSNVPSEVTDFCNNGRTLYAKTIPRDWGGLGVTPTVMEEWITLAGDIAVIRFRFQYLGDWNNAAMHQEVPAFFVRREFENLTFYQGNAPWTGAAVTSVLPNQLQSAGNQYIGFNEPWLAYLNASNWGVGLYKRGEDEATCYRYKSIGDDGATSYFAFLDNFALTPGTVHDYTIYMKIGSAGELRTGFQELYQAGL